MKPDQVQACLIYLTAAETLLEEAQDHASLARLSLTIDLLRRAHQLPDRRPPQAEIDWFGLIEAKATNDPTK